MRITVAIILLIVIIGFGIFEQIYIDSIVDDLTDKINDIIDNIKTDNMSQALEQTNDTKEWWNKKLMILEIMLPHDILTDISVQIADIEGQLQGDDASQAIGACYVLLGICDNAPHLLGFQLQHIF